MPHAMPLLRPGQPHQRPEIPGRAVDPLSSLDPGLTLTIVEQPRSASPELAGPAAPAAAAAPVDATFVSRLLTGWSVESEVIDAVECLTGELARRAADQGHGLTVLSVSFADRRLRVAVVDDSCNGDTDGRWFELSRGPAGACAQPEPAARVDRST